MKHVTLEVKSMGWVDAHIPDTERGENKKLKTITVIF